MSSQELTEREKGLLRIIDELKAKLNSEAQPPPNPVQFESQPSSSSPTKPKLEIIFDRQLPSLIEYWNQVTCNESHDAEDDQTTPVVPTFFLGLLNKSSLDGRFTYTVVRSSSPPPPITAHAAGMQEQNLRHAIRFQFDGLLETTSQEPKWGIPAAHPFFGGWQTLVPYTLGESKDLMREVADKDQARWDAANVDLEILGNTVKVEGFFGIVRSWFTCTDWLSLYRSQSRVLLAWDGRSVNDKDDFEILQRIESELFDTTKYYGASELLTVITYGEGLYGTITILRVSLESRNPIARVMMNIGTMRDRVPKALLKGMQLKHQLKIASKDGEIIFLDHGGQGYPCLMSAQTVTMAGGGKSTTPWCMGDGWRKALGIQHDPEKEKDGLVATIPQMIALLHLKGSALSDLHSTQAFSFSSPVSSTSPQSRYNISRAVKITSGPNGYGHPGRKVTVKVLFPNDSEWAKEKILWA